MYKRTLALLALMLLCCFAAAAQQAQPQPLTFWSDYTIKPGKEEDFMNVVKIVGQPVRDKLMAEGVVMAWGIEVNMIRGLSPSTHTVWYSVADWAGFEKVQKAMQAQLAKLAADDAKAAEEARKKNQKPGMTTAERIREITDESKTRDYLTRDLVSAESNAVAASGLLPYTRYNFTKVKPGKGAAYRAAWEKYNKPVLDKLIADGVVLAYGLGVEEVKTVGEITHFTWYATADLGGMDKVRSAYAADRARRSQEERDSIAETFASLTDSDAARGNVTRSIVFRVPGQK